MNPEDESTMPSDTNPPTPPATRPGLHRTNPLVYATGTPVCLISAPDLDELPDSHLIEAWVYYLREQTKLTDAQLDWHFLGTYAVVQALPEHHEAATSAAREAKRRLTSAGYYVLNLKPERDESEPEPNQE